MCKLSFVTLEHEYFNQKYLFIDFDVEKLTSSKFLSFEEKDFSKVHYFSSKSDFIRFFKSDSEEKFCHCIIDNVLDKNSLTLELTCVNLIKFDEILFSFQRLFIFC